MLERTDMTTVKWIVSITLIEIKGNAKGINEEEPATKAIAMPVSGRRRVGKQRKSWRNIMSHDIYGN